MPGDSLWRISRRISGEGERYTLIYDATQEQIRDPDLIDPRQVLVLPGTGSPDRTPWHGPGNDARGIGLARNPRR